MFAKLARRMGRRPAPSKSPHTPTTSTDSLALAPGLALGPIPADALPPPPPRDIVNTAPELVRWCSLERPFPSVAFGGYMRYYYCRDRDAVVEMGRFGGEWSALGGVLPAATTTTAAGSLPLSSSLSPPEPRQAKQKHHTPPPPPDSTPPFRRKRATSIHVPAKLTRPRSSGPTSRRPSTSTGTPAAKPSSSSHTFNPFSTSSSGRPSTSTGTPAAKPSSSSSHTFNPFSTSSSGRPSTSTSTGTPAARSSSHTKFNPSFSSSSTSSSSSSSGSASLLDSGFRHTPPDSEYSLSHTSDEDAVASVRRKGSGGALCRAGSSSSYWTAPSSAGSH